MTMAGKFDGKHPKVATIVKAGARWSNTGFWVFPDGSKGWYGWHTMAGPDQRGTFVEAKTAG